MIMSLMPDSGLSESWRCSAEDSDRLVFLITLLDDRLALYASERGSQTTRNDGFTRRI
jgi:hypothetical protein